MNYGSLSGSSELAETQRSTYQDPVRYGVTNDDVQLGIASPPFSFHEDKNKKWDGDWEKAHLSWVDSPESTIVSIQGQVVTIRNRDGWIDLNELLSLLDVRSQDKQRLEHFFHKAATSNRQHRPQQEDSRTWVSYGTIQLLCDKLNLSQQLTPLLDLSLEMTDQVGCRPCAGLEDHIDNYRTVKSRESSVYIPASGIASSTGDVEFSTASTEDGVALPQEKSSAANPLTCGQCNMSFRRKQDKRRHEEAIHGDRSFPCPFCRQNFNRSDNRINHIRDVHGAAPEKASCDELESDGSPYRVTSKLPHFVIS